MCDDCRDKATDNILSIVDKGYALDIAIRLSRDAVVQSYLADSSRDQTVDDIQKLSDDVTCAGVELLTMASQYPAQFMSLLLLHRYERRRQGRP